VRLTRTESLFITAILFLLDSAALGYFTVQKTIDFYVTKLFICMGLVLGFADFGKETCDFPFLLLLYY